MNKTTTITVPTIFVNSVSAMLKASSNDQTVEEFVVSLAEEHYNNNYVNTVSGFAKLGDSLLVPANRNVDEAGTHIEKITKITPEWVTFECGATVNRGLKQLFFSKIIKANEE